MKRRRHVSALALVVGSDLANSTPALNSLQGALGKTAGRSYKAAPRQLLQVDASGTSPTVSPAHAHISKADAVENTTEGEGAAKEAAKIGKEALSGHEVKEFYHKQESIDFFKPPIKL